MRTFFHGFYWQEGIRWRLASSPLVLYKSVGGECHVWLWNDFSVLHDYLLGIGRDRTRSQFRLQEVEVKPPSTSHMVGGCEPFCSNRGEEAIPKASSLPAFIIPYWIEAVNELISFNSIWKNQMPVIWGLIERFYRRNPPIICASSALFSKSIEMCREPFLCKARGTFCYAAVSGIIVDSGVLCTYSVSTVLSAFSAGTAVDSAICELELANGCIYLAAQYPS